VEVFKEVAVAEDFWLNIHSGQFKGIISEWGQKTGKKISLDELEEIAGLFATLIDMKSPFTTRHSVGVATLSAMIASHLGFDNKAQQAIRIAGLLHDLGKIIIPNKILEKPGKLTKTEILIVKQHSYYTYYLLSKIKGLGKIPEWAAFHHEKMDGSGYPFHYTGRQLSLGSRIIGVIDIFQAMTEERPYRKALGFVEVKKIMAEQVKNRKLDPKIVETLFEII
jgi:HD-GYP domain-containing protein (c-di-GMP phosphodiesterase class II)